MHFGNRAGRPLAPLVLLLLLLASVAQASVQSELAFHRGVIAYGDERWDDAKQQFEIVLGEDAEDTVALHYLALVAQKQGDPAAALAYYDRVLALEPDDPEVLLDRGSVLLQVGRVDEARQAFARVIELEPDNGRAQLFAGMAAYRAGDHEGAKPYLAKAGELDPTLRDEARYYSGLSDAILGNTDAAAAAFSDTAEQSPLSPLGQSAQNFKKQLEAPTAPERAWSASLTAGMEVDTNPLIAGGRSPAFPTVPGNDTDFRGVVLPRGRYRLFSDGKASLSVGYDGYFSWHIDEEDVNLQTHNPNLSASYDFGPARASLRYDYAFTLLDTDKPYRHLHRVTPSLTVPEGDWGASVLFYQFHYQDFLNSLPAPGQPVLDRDGFRHVPGFTQFFFLPQPFTYVRVGILGSLLDTDGTEFKHDSIETQFGAGYDFDYDISFNWLYRFEWRDYDNLSQFSSPVGRTARRDYEHSVTAEIGKLITDHWQASVGMALTFNDSNVQFYDYDRQVGGAYVTYRF